MHSCLFKCFLFIRCLFSMARLGSSKCQTSTAVLISKQPLDKQEFLSVVLALSHKTQLRVDLPASVLVIHCCEFFLKCLPTFSEEFVQAVTLVH